TRSRRTRSTETSTARATILLRKRATPVAVPITLLARRPASARQSETGAFGSCLDWRRSVALLQSISQVVTLAWASVRECPRKSLLDPRRPAASLSASGRAIGESRGRRAFYVAPDSLARQMRLLISTEFSSYPSDW